MQVKRLAFAAMDQVRDGAVLTDFRSAATIAADPAESRSGGVAEWPNAPVLKTGEGPLQTPENPAVFDHVAKTLPQGLPADLLEVIWGWHALPDPLKAAILAIIRTKG